MLEYGITTCKAQLQVFFCPATCQILIFSTRWIKDFIKDNNFRKVHGPTFIGILVPIKELINSGEILHYSIPKRIIEQTKILELKDPEKIGNLGEKIITSWLNHMNMKEVQRIREKHYQIEGYDVVTKYLTLQIKTDTKTTSGNIFLQTHEKR